MKSRMFLLLVAMACATASFAKDVKTRGTVLNHDSLLRIRSYCLGGDSWFDSSVYGAPVPLGEELKFAKKEASPKKSLGRLGWKLTDDCDVADAVMSFNSERGAREPASTMPAPSGQGMATLGGSGLSTFVAELIVWNRTSRMPIYRVRGFPVTDRDVYPSMKGAVENLRKDLQKLSSNSGAIAQP